MSERKGVFPAPGHDHGGCVSGALRAAEALCQGKGVRLTGLRRRVLEIVWGSHRPVGAYAVLEVLRESKPAAPPTVYRALDFLQAHGLVHRIASLNAYVGCDRPDTPHQGHFFICSSCRDIAELSDSKLSGIIQNAAEDAGFEVHRQTVEVLGRCARCRDSNGGPRSA